MSDSGGMQRRVEWGAAAAALGAVLAFDAIAVRTGYPFFDLLAHGNETLSNAYHNASYVLLAAAAAYCAYRAGHTKV